MFDGRVRVRDVGCRAEGARVPPRRPRGSIPTGLGGWMSRRWFEPFVDAGYAVHVVTRRRRMPRGHGVTDMADDVAELISNELGGRADLVVGVSFGGMIAQHLAARHGALLGHVAVIVAAAEVCDWGKDVDAAPRAGRRLGRPRPDRDDVRRVRGTEPACPPAASPGRPLARKEPALREALPAGGPGGRDRGRAGVRRPVRPPEDRGAGPVRVRGPGPVLHARGRRRDRIARPRQQRWCGTRGRATSRWPPAVGSRSRCSSSSAGAERSVPRSGRWTGSPR